MQNQWWNNIMEPTFQFVTVAIGTFTSFYFVCYLCLSTRNNAKLLARYEEQVLQSLQEVEQSLPDSSEIENIVSRLLSVLSNKEEEERKEEHFQQQLFDENMASYLSSFICNTSLEIEKSDRELLITQHGIAKDLFHWHEIGQRVQDCRNYYENFTTFFQAKKAKPSKLNLAFVHNIEHHADIGLLELFLLTFASPNDFHCIHVNNELNGETPKILTHLISCFNRIWGQPRLFLANQETPEFWKKASESANLELICLRELLEFSSDWHYVIFKGRHSLPLVSRIDLERQIVERIHGMSYFSDQLAKSHFIGAAFIAPTKTNEEDVSAGDFFHKEGSFDGVAFYSLPDDHVVTFDHENEVKIHEWTLSDAIVSWDLANFIINDLSQSALKRWLKNPADLTSQLPAAASNSKLTISTVVESRFETSKRFILQRYFSPGYTPKIKRNDLMSVCNGKSHSLWWNDANGGCPQTSDKRWCFLRLTDLGKAYDSSYYDDCFFSNRFSLGAHPTSAICHSLNIWQLSQN